MEPQVSLKDMISGGKKVRFQYYRSKELWYKTDEGNFEFPVPIEDCGDGIFLDVDLAIFFMRYIRKHLDFLEQAKKEQQVTESEKTHPSYHPRPE